MLLSYSQLSDVTLSSTLYLPYKDSALQTLLLYRLLITDVVALALVVVVVLTLLFFCTCRMRM